MTTVAYIQSLQDLKSLPQWVCFTPDKMPFNPSGIPAKANDSQTWASFEQVARAWRSSPDKYAGIGFEFVKEQGITGVDLDKCIAEDGTISEYAQHIVNLLNSYTEKSPSGRGLHIWVRGEIPNNIGPDPTGIVKIEMYDHARYFTITGARLDGTPTTFEERQDVLSQLHANVTSQRQQAKLAKQRDQAPKTPRPAGLTIGSDSPYGLAALNNECRDLVMTTEGGRNSQLNYAAFRLGQLIGGNELSRSTVERELFAAAESAGLNRNEIDKTMQSGLNAGLKDPRTRPVDDLIYGNGGNGGNAGNGNNTTTGDNREPDTQFILECLREGEYGDSILFARLFRGQVIYDHTAGEWYTWKGHWWEEDGTGKIKHLVSGKLASVYIKAGAALNLQASQQEAKAEIGGDDQDKATAKERVTFIKKQIKELTDRAFTLRQVSRCKNILYFAQSHDGMGITADMWDRNPWLLAVPNGVIDLHTGECRDGKPEDYIRTSSPTIWKGIDTPAPRWEQFLQEIFEDRPAAQRKELIDFLQRMLGYGITGEVTEHIFAILYGEDGRNGKDTLQRTISHTLGKASGAVHKDVLLDTGRGHTAGAATPHLSALQGRRLAWANEPEKGARFNVGQIKDLSGGGEIPTRGLHEKKYTMIKPSHLLILLTNHKPHADADDAAFWGRLCMITFNIRFVDRPAEKNERKKDTSLWTTLENEASGILAWLVRGCLSWQLQGLNTPDQVRDAVSEYQEEEDDLKTFIDECCVVGQGLTVQASKLYEAYEKWAQFGNRYVLKITPFGRQMVKKKFEKRKEGTVKYFGIGLLDTSNDDNSGQFGKSSGQFGQSHTNYPKLSETASQATSSINNGANSGQFGQSPQVFTKNGSYRDDFLEKPVKTIQTIQGLDNKSALDKPVEPLQDSLDSSNKLSKTVQEEKQTIQAGNDATEYEEFDV